jgi:hypothetical protein
VANDPEALEAILRRLVLSPWEDVVDLGRRMRAWVVRCHGLEAVARQLASVVG